MSIRGRAAVASVLGAAGLTALLLVAAGTSDWPTAWVFAALFALVGILGAVVAPTSVLRERMRGPLRPGEAGADVVFVVVFGLVLLSWFVLMALDARRFEWTSVPPVLTGLGALAFLLANGVALWVICANPFASASVRIDDAQRVATDGPYRIVRHPMYACVLLYVPGTALLLGSLWGAVATVVIVLALVVRIAIEERMLRAGLAGYAEYAARVRWRLLPGVW